MRKLYTSMFNKYRVDMTLTGHTHNVGFHPPVEGKNEYPVVIGGGPGDGNRTITKIYADPQKRQVIMIRDDGKEIINNCPLTNLFSTSLLNPEQSINFIPLQLSLV